MSKVFGDMDVILCLFNYTGKVPPLKGSSDLLAQ